MSVGEEILAMKKSCEQMQPYLQPDCPVCGWVLETSIDGIRHCKLCGWTDHRPINRGLE